MSIVAAALVFAQSAVLIVADAPARGAVAVQATASARVLRPARISLGANGEIEHSDTQASAAVQRGRDSAGTVWIEFS